MNENVSFQIFLEIHDENPQEGPGNSESTNRAFSQLTELPPFPRILDVGCGPGRQTIDLCRLTDGTIMAVDLHQQYINALNQKSQDLGLTQRIATILGDMANLPFAPKSFDVIWSEGAIYNIGFKAGLEAWKPLLKKAGYIALTELTWSRSDAPDELKRFWEEGYPKMQDLESNLTDLQTAGYKIVGHFFLPESAWWDYYHPIEKRITRLKEKYMKKNEALRVFEMELREIDLYRKYSEFYGYVFYIGQAV